MNELELKKSLLSSPGDTIQEHIDHIGMSQAELAERLGRSIPKLNDLIKGKAPITKETAIKLEYVLGVKASFWLNLERTYQDELLDIEQLERLQQWEEWVDSFPLSVLKRLDILPMTKKKTVLVDRLLKFFRVASPQQWSDIYRESSLAFNVELRNTAEPQAISVWLRLGELQADKLKVAKFSKPALRACLPKLRSISFEAPDNWLEQLQSLFASCGLALVYTPSIAKAPIHGATRWLKNNSMPLIQISDKPKSYNDFWFSLYHQLAHILYHGKKDVFIDGLKPDPEKEVQADAFASRMILTEKERKLLNQYRDLGPEMILHFSKEFKRHPSILVSQIQRSNKHLYNNAILNRLKAKVEFKELSL